MAGGRRERRELPAWMAARAAHIERSAGPNDPGDLQAGIDMLREVIERVNNAADADLDIEDLLKLLEGLGRGWKRVADILKTQQALDAAGADREHFLALAELLRRDMESRQKD